MLNQKERVKKNKITNIKRSKRFSDRIIIQLNNKSVFRVPEDAFALKPLHVGDEVTAKEINHYDDKMRIQEAKDAAFRLLSFRMRSISEMKRRLKQKSFTNDEINNVINKLIKLDFLNDAMFAKTFINEKIKNKKIGPRALRSELFPHHLSSDLINQLIEKAYKKYDINELISYHLNRKKINKSIQLNKKELTRLNNYLLRKGFEWDNISNVYHKWGLI